MYIINYISWLLYYGFARHLPASTSLIKLGGPSLRRIFTKGFIKKAGKNINIEHGAIFSKSIVIGDNSGIGIDCVLQGEIVIGNNVMMGPQVWIYTRNHEHGRTDIPMIKQGFEQSQKVVIEDDVWIGARVTILPGLTIGRGSIIGASAVVTKDVPEYSIVAGNPAKVVKMRKRVMDSEGLDENISSGYCIS